MSEDELNHKDKVKLVVSPTPYSSWLHLLENVAILTPLLFFKILQGRTREKLKGLRLSCTDTTRAREKQLVREYSGDE